MCAPPARPPPPDQIIRCPGGEIRGGVSAKEVYNIIHTIQDERYDVKIWGFCLFYSLILIFVDCFCVYREW